jgi:hypothetical protein
VERFGKSRIFGLYSYYVRRAERFFGESAIRRTRHKVTGLQGIIICSPLKCPVRSYLPLKGISLRKGGLPVG